MERGERPAGKHRKREHRLQEGEKDTQQFHNGSYSS